VTSQSLSKAQVQGIAHLESCLPNGKAVVGSVMNGSVSWQNGVQLASALGYQVSVNPPFVQSNSAHLQATEHRCLPGSKNHPFLHAQRLFEKCIKNPTTGVQTTVLNAEKPYKATVGYHLVSDHHQMELAAFQATVRVAAACVGSVK
jgi:mannose-1-phosphate guanylyltransferase